MSIIYDALKKTQQNREDHFSPTPQKEKSSYASRMKKKLFLAGFLVGIIVLANYPLLTKKSAIHPATAPTAQHSESLAANTAESTPQISTPNNIISTVQAAFSQTLVLNGVFITNKNKSALINQHFYNLGDTVGNMKIVSIEPKRVRLQNQDGENLELQTAL